MTFLPFALSNYWDIFADYQNVTVSLKHLSLSFEELIENDAYEKNSFQFLLFIVCIGYVCANYLGRMSTEGAG